MGKMLYNKNVKKMQCYILHGVVYATRIRKNLKTKAS